MKRALKPLTPLLLLPFCAAGLLAQSAAVLAPRNADFMRGLMNARYLDMAEGLAKTVAASALPDKEKSAIAILVSALDVYKAGLGGDPAARKDALLTAIRQKETAIAAAPESADAATLRDEVANQYGQLATAYQEALKAETDPQKQAAMRKEGDALFVAAIKTIEEQKAAAEKKKVEDKPETEIPFVVAFFNLGRMRYYHSLLFAPDSFECKHAIEQALSTLDEFDLEFGDLLVAFEAKLTAALCHKQLGNLDDAMGCLDDAISLRERVEKGSNGVYKVDPSAGSVISSAVAQKLLFLADKENWQKVIEVGKDFFATIPEPMQTSQGITIAAAMGKAHLQLNENDAAKTIAQNLIEFDPKGRGEYEGQRILGELATGTPGKGTTVQESLKLAGSLAAQGQVEQALQLCRQTVLGAKGPDDAKYAAEAMMITGAIFATQKWYHEASLAYDTVWRRWPQSTFAPDAIWRSLNCYVELLGEEGQPFYKRAIDERGKLLTSKHPNDPHVPELQLVEAKQLEKAGKLLEATAAYEKIPTTDPVISLQARYRASNCFLRYGRKLQIGRLAKESAEFLGKAEAGMLKVLTDVATNLQATTDARLKASFESIEFGARTTLANIYLGGDKPRPAEAQKVLEPLKAKDGSDDSSVLWALRTSALIAQDKIDEAVAMFDELINKGGDQKALAPVAGKLAQALDARATQTQKEGLRTRANEIWRRSVGYYLRFVERAPADEVGEIAFRLFTIGLMTNGVDAKVESFFEVPDLKATETGTWEQSADLYDRLIQQGNTNYRIAINLGRALGFIKRWKEAERVYGELFAQNKLFNKAQQIDRQVLGAKSELLTAYLEWAYATKEAAAAAEDQAGRARAVDAFKRIANNVPKDSKHWWFATYGQIRTDYERGNYVDADVDLRLLERNNPDLDNDRYKLKSKFMTLKLDIAQKVPRGSGK